MVLLFRPQAIENRRIALIGDATLPLPPSMPVITLVLAIMVAALCAFLAFGSYARREQASGYLVSQPRSVRVMPTRAGIVVIVYVAEGDLVAPDDKLLSINDEQSTVSGEAGDAAKLLALHAQHQALREQVELAQRKAALEQTTLDEAIGALSSQVIALRATHDTQATRVGVAREQLLAVSETVSRGFTSVTEQQRRRDTWLSQTQSEQSIAGEILARQAELGKQRSALARLPLDTNEEISHLQSALADIEIKIVELGEHRGYVLRAPVAGRVSALQAWPGKTVEPGIPQLSIVPQNAQLRAELLVPARSIGFVAAGQPVRLSYDTFPYQQFGFADGVVDMVSNTLLKPDELVGPFVLKEPSYRVGVALRRQTMPAYGRQIPLQPDLQLRAGILFERRSLLAWLFDPVRSAAGTGG